MAEANAAPTCSSGIGRRERLCARGPVTRTFDAGDPWRRYAL